MAKIPHQFSKDVKATAAYLVYCNPALDGSLRIATALIDHAADALGRGADDDINRREADAALTCFAVLLREDTRKAQPEILPKEPLVKLHENGEDKETTLFKYMTKKTQPFSDLHTTINSALQRHQIYLQRRGTAAPTQKNRNSKYIPR